MTFCYKTLKTLSHVSWIQNDALVHQGGLKGCNKKLYNSLALHQEGLKCYFLALFTHIARISGCHDRLRCGRILSGFSLKYEKEILYYLYSSGRYLSLH